METVTDDCVSRANDASQNVSASDFVDTYVTFVKKLRREVVTRNQPIFVFTPVRSVSPENMSNCSSLSVGDSGVGHPPMVPPPTTIKASTKSSSTY
jgi:hypothetical protein